MDFVAVISVTIALLGFALASRRLEDTVLTGPLVFTLIGLLFGPAALGLVPIPRDHSLLHALAEITLVLVLFSDAVHVDLRQLRRDHDLPLRMLLIGMPLSLAAGVGIALALFAGLPLFEAALLSAILVPTDAALGQAVVSQTAVPVRIRQALVVESRLNDGIALPLVIVFASLASTGAAAGSASDFVAFAARQVTLGPLAGVLVGIVGGLLVKRAWSAGWMTQRAEGIVALSLAGCMFAVAESIGGNGFIAAFVGGLAFGNVLQHRCAFLYQFAETEGRILMLLTFLVVGASMLPEALPELSPAVLLYALLALTVMRIVPITLSLVGTGVRPVTCLFLGWFGPRGLASVLFVLLVLEESELTHGALVFAAATVTVGASVLLHGITANAGARWYGVHARTMGACAENEPVPEIPYPESRLPDEEPSWS